MHLATSIFIDKSKLLK